MRRGEYNHRVHDFMDEHDDEIYCSGCGKKFYVWEGMSVIECPYCGKVSL